MEIKEVTIGTTGVKEEENTPESRPIITINAKDVNECAEELYVLLYEYKSHQDNANAESSNHYDTNCEHSNSSFSKHDNKVFPHINATELTRITNICRVLDQIKSWSLEETHLPPFTSSVIASTSIPQLILEGLNCERPAIVLSCLEILHHLVQQSNSFDKVKSIASELGSECKLTDNEVFSSDDSTEQTCIDGSVTHEFVNGINLITILVKLMQVYAKKLEIQVEVMNVLRAVLSKEIENDLMAVPDSAHQLEKIDNHVNEEIVNLVIGVMHRESDSAEVQIAAVSLLTAISDNWSAFWEEYSNSVFTLPSITQDITINISIWELLLAALSTHWTNLELKRVCFHFLRNALLHDYGRYYLMHTTITPKLEPNKTCVWQAMVENSSTECKVWKCIWDKCTRALPLSAYTIDVFRDVCEIIGHLLPIATFAQTQELMKVLRMLLLKHGTTEVLTLTLGLLHAIFIKINHKTKSMETEKTKEQKRLEMCSKPSIAAVHGAYQLYPQPQLEQPLKQNEEKQLFDANTGTVCSDNDCEEVQLCVRAIVDLCLPQLIMHVIEYHQYVLAVQEMSKTDDDDNVHKANDVNLELLCVVAQNCLKALPL